MEQRVPTPEEKKEALEAYHKKLQEAKEIEKAFIDKAKEITEYCGMPEKVESIYFFLHHPAETPLSRHEQWIEDRKVEGWEYGPVKDYEKKTHPWMVPYEELTESVRADNVKMMKAIDELTKMPEDSPLKPIN